MVTFDGEVYYVVFWKHDRPQTILAGPFHDLEEAANAAKELDGVVMKQKITLTSDDF